MKSTVAAASLICSVRVAALNCGQLSCLPGLDGVGVGFDAVTGLTALRTVDLTFAAGNTYTDRFGSTVYAVPDQAMVTTGTTQSVEHQVVRSASQWVETQTNRAGIKAGYGLWFSASTQTSDVAKTMSDGMHIVIESRQKVTLYKTLMNPPAQLVAHHGFQDTIDKLPTDYDYDAYHQVVKYYGTHYVHGAELGGLAQMRTVATQSYFSSTLDSELQAQAHVQWELFGGSGGSGSSKHQTSQAWKDGTTSSTYTQGGDPAIRSFDSPDAWTRWAKSVETSAPVQAQFWLEDLASLVKDAGKAANLGKAISEYAALHNATWPGADPVEYTLGWCDCKSHHSDLLDDHTGYMTQCSNNKVLQHNCPEGKVMVSFELKLDDHGRYEVDCKDQYNSGSKCCRPCFKVRQDSVSMVKTIQQMSEPTI